MMPASCCVLALIAAIGATEPAEVRSRVDVFGLEAGGYAAGGEAWRPTVFVLQGFGEHELTPTWRARWRVGLVRHSTDDMIFGQSVTRLGNPALSVHRQRRLGPIAASLGVGITLPLAHVLQGHQTRVVRSAYAYAAASSGLAELWLWAPDHAALLAPLAATWLPGRFVALAFEVTPAAMMPVRDGSGVGDLLLDTAVQASLRLDGLAAGLRGQAVLVATQPRDRLQLACQPFVEVGGERWRLRGAFTTPLGDPLALFDLWHFALSVTYRSGHEA